MAAVSLQVFFCLPRTSPGPAPLVCLYEADVVDEAGQVEEDVNGIVSWQSKAFFRLQLADLLEEAEFWG